MKLGFNSILFLLCLPLFAQNAAEVIQNSKKFKFVIAESGLNYRSEPNGKVLGKFEWRAKVEYLYETGITQKIIDNYSEVEGTWVAVKQKKIPFLFLTIFCQVQNLTSPKQSYIMLNLILVKFVNPQIKKISGKHL